MSTTIKKQIGDRVVITGGPRKGIQGNISALQGLKATIKLDDGTEVPAGVAWLDFVIIEHPETPVETAMSEIESALTEISVVTDEIATPLEVASDTEQVVPVPVEPQAESALSEQQLEKAPIAPVTAPVATKRARKRNTEPASETATEANVAQNPYEKMTVNELQKLAKARNISVARTKADFVHIIKELEPDIDTETLKGPALFNKVSDLHISRLRSKKDLVTLLSVE